MRDQERIIREAAAQGSNIIENWRRRSRLAQRLQLLLIAFLILACFALLGLFLYGITKRIPSTIYFRARESQNLDLRVPATGEVRPVSVGGRSNVPKEGVVIDLSCPVCMRTAGQDRYSMEVKLFGLIPLKKVDIRVIEDQMLIPMGIPVGIYLEDRGIMVVGIAEFMDDHGISVSPAKNLLKTGDLILKINGMEVSGKQDLLRAVKDSGGLAIRLGISREGREQEVVLSPVMNEAGEYRIGAWVRDNAQGVGTLTYVDANGDFGALGHAIGDVDTGIIVGVKDGALYQTEIVKLRRGENGSPGEMTGRITYDERYVLGNVRENTERGIYGTCNAQGLRLATGEALPIGLKQEIDLGPAQILCTLDHEVECFEVEIIKVDLGGAAGNRGIELLVTDKELLRR
ncbi:MAG: SpoIVB peptidase, partial [Lachnospiraceae bacterium]|nr:SpoIVB peptidase [Lachnospiraceae bacterium]